MVQKLLFVILILMLLAGACGEEQPEHPCLEAVGVGRCDCVPPTWGRITLHLQGQAAGQGQLFPVLIDGISTS